MKRILVLGAGGSAGINFIDGLRMAPENLYIVGSDINKWHIELPDVDKRYILPRCTDEKYVDKLNRLIELEKIQFVHAQPDPEVKTISENREKINALTFLPSKKTISICQDKKKTIEILKRKNVPVPETVWIEDEKSIYEAFDRLKVSDGDGKIWFRALRGAGSKAALPIKDPEHAKMWIDYWKTMKHTGYGSFIASEFLPGKEFAFQSVWKDGELVVSQARERLEYLFGNITPSGQTSTPSVAKTVHREDINDVATRAVLAIDNNPNGIFCIDLKENKQGIPCITEINSGRFFTTSNFFAKLGVNMQYIYVKLAYKEKIPELPKCNPILEGYYWIRLPDKRPILVEEGKWRSTEV
jgi:carbamoyl-phosphate synthase large subunit